MANIVLVNMPFANPGRPSLALGLLKSGLQAHGISSRIIDANVYFATLIGLDAYKAIINLPTEFLAGEWVFARATLGPDPHADEAFSKLIEQNLPTADTLALLLEARKAVPRFLESMLKRLLVLEPSIIGFSSNFHQNTPSLALANLVKASASDIYLVFGGANCEGIMGRTLFSTFNSLDAVVSGDGDEAFPALCSEILKGRKTSVPGVLQRNSSIQLTSAPVSTVQDLDRLQFPDYDDYFDTLEEIGWPEWERIELPFETSRGCWWGTKQHCTFCGLNGSSMASRVKSSDRAIEELRWLSTRYGAFTDVLCATDNILPHQYHKSFLPALEAAALPIRLFYEIKSNIDVNQIAQMKRAGISAVQPGIESFSTPLLRHMKKGTTRLKNILTLRSCREHDIKVYWNYLIGFPGEDAEWYQSEIELLPKLLHLHPPSMPSTRRVRFDRFSPYVESYETFGISNLQPAPAYAMVYSGIDNESLRNLAYYFVGSFSGETEIGNYESALNDIIHTWHVRTKQATLAWLPTNNLGNATIIDQRSCETLQHDLTALEALILRFCHEIRTISAIAELAVSQGYSTRDTVAGLKSLDDKGLLVHEDESAVSLCLNQ